MAVDHDRLAALHRDHIAHLERGYAGALESAGYAAVVIHSGTPLKRTEADDQFWPLRPVPHFQHWLPLVQPDCALIVRPGARPRLLWSRPENEWETLPEPEWDGWQAAFDIEVVTDPDPAAMQALLPRTHPALITDARTPPDWGLEAINPPVLVAALDQIRVQKTAYEVACIAEANRRAAEGHRRVAAAFRDGDAAEIDLHLAFLAATRQDDPETPYKNIVALGAHAATLHHIAYARRAPGRPHESLLIDAGAAFLGYTSDVTRTHAKGTGAAADAFRNLIERMNGVQQRLCAEIAVGLPFPDLHERAHQYIAAVLAGAGIVRMDPEEMAAAGVTRTFFPHGLGHSLGLQCHDVGCTAVPASRATDYLRNTTSVSVGQVFTVEPGLYFIDGRLRALRAGPHGGTVDWPLVEALSTFGGIRIEDNIHVRGGPGDGVIDNLTRTWLP